MSRRFGLFRALWRAALAALLVVLVLGPTGGSAYIKDYEVGRYWVYNVNWWSDITDQNNYGVFPPGTRDAIRTSARTWNSPDSAGTVKGIAAFGFMERDDNYAYSRGWFSARDFGAEGWPTYIPGITVNWDPAPGHAGYIWWIESYLNTLYSWNLDGHFEFPFEADVRTVSTHELGHWLSLDHDQYHQEAVMWPAWVQRWELAQDDVDGIRAWYGKWLYTGWEDSQPIGYGNLVAYQKDMAGYYCNQSPPPEASRVPAGEWGIGPLAYWRGSWQLRLAGCAQSSYSYVYFLVIDFDPPLYIEPGMYLWWHEYKYQQSTMSVDARFTDGSNLRDSGVFDQNGVNVHPAARYVYGQGGWYWFQANLSPVVGKSIDRLMVAYDNGITHQTDRFRAYFDNITIGRPWPP